MPTIAPITLTDDLAGNSLVFAPIDDNPEKNVLISRSSESSSLDSIITSGLNGATNNRRTNKTFATLSVPVETSTYAVDGVSVIDTARFKCEMVIPTEFSEAQRQLFEEHCQSLVSTTAIRGITRDLDPMY